MGKDYSDIGLDKRLRAKSSLTNRPQEYQTALEHSLRVEPTPFLHRTSVLNRGGTLQITGGAAPNFETTTGGTQIFGYNPATGAVILRSLGNSGTSFVLVNAGGTERIRMISNSGGAGLIDADEFRFTPNTGNRLDEQFGPRARLADAGGTNGLKVLDSGGTEIFEFSSARWFEMQGTIADPGGGPTNSARIFSGTSGTANKADLRVEFATGVSVKLAGEP